MSEFTVIGLRVLREVAADGSFTAAAARLGYTQSAVSRQIAALEAAAGTQLFERLPRGARLSAAGQLVLRHAIGVLDQLDSARRELGGLHSQLTGRLRVGAFQTALAALVPRALTAFAARYPEVRVSLREGTTPAQLRRLAAGTVDLAVLGTVPHPVGTGEFGIEPLVADPLLVAVGRAHPLANRRTVALDELAGERWIASSGTVADTFLGAWAAPRWQPSVAFVVREWTAKLGLVAANLGVTLVPGIAASAVRKDVALLRVRGSQLARRQMLIATPTAAESVPDAGSGSYAAAFAEFLHEAAAELTGELGSRLT